MRLHGFASRCVKLVRWDQQAAISFRKRDAQAAVALGVSVTLLAGCGSSTSSPSASKTTSTLSRSAPATLPFTALVKRVRSGVVRIEVTTCQGKDIGTGFLLGPQLVATVEHVVDGATKIALKQNGKVVGHGVVIGEDTARDVALVHSDTPISGYRFALSSRAPQLGEDVAAIGFPFGLPLTVTRGSVSGLDRTIPIANLKRQKLVQTDAPVNPGNSGGPLMTDTGTVVGLVDLGTTQANGLAFAVSAKVAAPLLQAWRNAPQAVAAATCATQPPPAVNATPAPSTTSQAPSLLTFTGQHFMIEYPPGWAVQAAEQNRGTYLDTTLLDPQDSSVLMRIDMTAGITTTNLLQTARPVINSLRRQSGYQELDLSYTTFEGYPALHWEFVVNEGGQLMRKEDEFFIDGSDNEFGILTQAPDSVYSSVTDGFAALRGTFITFG
jgi:hypothetical protein